MPLDQLANGEKVAGILRSYDRNTDLKESQQGRLVEVRKGYEPGFYAVQSCR